MIYCNPRDREERIIDEVKYGGIDLSAENIYVTLEQLNTETHEVPNSVQRERYGGTDQTYNNNDFKVRKANPMVTPKSILASESDIYYRIVGEKEYEIKDHLGNVRVVISDKKLKTNIGFEADMLGYNNYYPFGMEMPSRTYSSPSYRYGFNGKEKDDEIYNSSGTSYDYGFRMYDPRIARFPSPDPIIVYGKQYPELSSYQYASLNPIKYIDLDGLEGTQPIISDGMGGGSLAPKSNLRVGNPVRTSSGFLTPILNENNNTVDNVKISLSRNVRSEWVTDHTAKVLSEVMFKSFNFSAEISSAFRSSKDQARVMYNNLIGTGEKQGVDAQRKLYGWAGDKVIDTFEAFSPEWNCTATECMAAMTNKINKIGPGNVSKHSSNPNIYNVIDIAPSSIENKVGFYKSVSNAVKSGDKIIKFISPKRSDPSYHLEIPQSN